MNFPPIRRRWGLSALLTSSCLCAVLLFGCSDDDDPSRPGGELTDQLIIHPSSARVLAGEQVDFDAHAQGEEVQAVQWRILSTQPAGTIDETGLYTAPADVSDEFTIAIEATASSLYREPALASVTVLP